MAVSYGKGFYGKATKLHSKIVRERKKCENCGDTGYRNLQCAHIISRKYSNTRTLEANAFCLCAKCHRFFSDWPVEFAEFVVDNLGHEEYTRLKSLAQGKKKVDWEKEHARLAKIAKDLGIERRG